MRGAGTYLTATIVIILTLAGVYQWIAGVLDRTDFVAYMEAVLGLGGAAVAIFARRAMADTKRTATKAADAAQQAALEAQKSASFAALASGTLQRPPGLP